MRMVEKLRRNVPMGEQHIHHPGTPINPDGPEAAALLEQAEAALNNCRVILRNSGFDTPNLDALLAKLREGGE